MLGYMIKAYSLNTLFLARFSFFTVAQCCWHEDLNWASHITHRCQVKILVCSSITLTALMCQHPNCDNATVALDFCHLHSWCDAPCCASTTSRWHSDTVRSSSLAQVEAITLTRAPPHWTTTLSATITTGPWSRQNNEIHTNNLSSLIWIEKIKIDFNRFIFKVIMIII